jgi:uncharacterized protein with von Willebrand factor type A (vWA) domain
VDTDNLPLEAPEMGNDVDYCPNPAPISAGAVGSADPSINLIRFASDFKGPARQMIQGNTRNAAAILLRYILGNAYNLSEVDNLRQSALEEVELMLNEVVPDHAESLLQRLNLRLDELLAEELQDPRQIGRHPLKIQNIAELPLAQLRPSPELQQALKKLGKRLASRHRRKIRQGSRKINLRKTIRANIQHGGTLLELKREKPRLDRPRLTILTDVSSSTIHATKLFLSIIWHAKEVFSDIRFFEFIANMIDVTAELKRAKSPEEGIETAIKHWERAEFGKENSDYYSAFRKFQRMRSKYLDQKETIILLGDLRDWLGPWIEGRPQSALIMGEVAQKVKRFIVLNPEHRRNWNTGDSIVQYVQNKGIEVYEATSLEKLINVILSL